MIDSMLSLMNVAQMLIRQLDDDVKTKLQERARRHGRSAEEEVREILRDAVREEAAPVQLGSRISARFGGLGLSGPLEELRGEEVHAADLAS